MGVSFTIETYRSSTSVANPDNGDTWSTEIRDQETGQTIGEFSMSYDAASDCLVWRGGTVVCGLYIPEGQSQWRGFWIDVRFTFQCLPTQPYRLFALFQGGALGDSPWDFAPTPFRIGTPTIDPIAEIRPYIPASPLASGTAPAIPEGTTTVRVRVRDSLGCGVPIPNAPVRLANSVVPGSGGHVHFARETEPGTGAYIESTPPWSSIDESRVSILAKTDAAGILQARYRAGIYGVEEAVSATATDPNNSTLVRDAEPRRFFIRLPGLVALDTSGMTYKLRGSYASDCDQGHNDAQTLRRSHYVTPSTYEMVQRLNDRWLAEGGDNLCLNDASLPFGGFFDNGGSTRGTKEQEPNKDTRRHVSHRRGIDIDVNVRANAPCTEDLDQLMTVRGKEVTKRERLDEIAQQEFGLMKAREEPIHYRF